MAVTQVFRATEHRRLCQARPGPNPPRITRLHESSPMTVGSDFVLNALVQEGLTHLFMVPGGLVDPFLPALARVSQLRPIVAAHEGGAAYMADGYARASGRFGAVLGIGGPGLTNMATAVAAAKTDGSPVLVLSGEIPLDMERSWRVPGREPDDARRYRGDEADHAALRNGAIAAIARSCAPPRAHGDVVAATGSGAPVAHPRRADRDDVCGLRAGPSVFQGSRPAERTGRDGRDQRPAQRAEDRVPRGRRRRARRCRASPQGARRTVVDPGRDHAARQGRVSGGPRTLARRLRLCRHPPCDDDDSRRSSGCAGRARLRVQRARHHALDAARSRCGPDRHHPCQHRHGDAHHPRHAGPYRARKLRRVPRADAA